MDKVFENRIKDIELFVQYADTLLTYIVEEVLTDEQATTVMDTIMSDIFKDTEEWLNE